MMDENIFIRPDTTVNQALKKLDLSAQKVLLVTDENRKLMGALSDGDIRRAILKGVGLDQSIEGTFNPVPLSLKQFEINIDSVKELFIREKIELLPVVNNDRVVVEYITWDQIFKEAYDVQFVPEKIDVPVVIMAGGKGTRLAPFTNILPKPLIPIGEKTILEVIIDEFTKFGIHEYFFTMNYRGEMIRAYFEGIVKDYTVDYIWEKEFLGTAGSLKLLEDKISSVFIVSNCDIIVKANYAEVLDFHRKNRAFLTVLSSIQHHVIPYGVLEFERGGEVTAIKEKPEFSFPINTGVYILQKECLGYIPDGKVFHMTDLMEILISKGKKVLTYPVNENDYVDIGQWEEYHKAMEKISRIK